jgi:hypothetical protein
MSYSCSDFTDDIMRALAVTAPDHDDGLDHVEEASTIACNEIERLQSVAKAHSDMREELAGLCAAIRSHYEGDEQDLDVLADDLIKKFELEPDIKSGAGIKF